MSSENFKRLIRNLRTEEYKKMPVYQMMGKKVQNKDKSKHHGNQKDKILEKLRKLMNLKESATALGNEGEANAAAAGITRLLMEYNLTEMIYQSRRS